MANVATKRKSGLRRWLGGWFAARAELSPELQQGVDLLVAIDAGGIPLNPARVNQIARNLGLEVSRNAAIEATIERIRAAVARGLDRAAAGKGSR